MRQQAGRIVWRGAMQALADHISALAVILSRTPDALKSDPHAAGVAEAARSKAAALLTPAQARQLLANARRHPDEAYKKAVFVATYPDLKWQALSKGSETPPDT